MAIQVLNGNLQFMVDAGKNGGRRRGRNRKSEKKQVLDQKTGAKRATRKEKMIYM